MSFASTTNPIVAPLSGSRDTQLGDQGNYFVANTAVPGAGQISSAVATFVETTPVVVLFNSSSAANPVNIYPMYLAGYIVTIGTGVASACNWTFTLDAGNRFTSGGAAMTVVNTNMNSNVGSVGIARNGALLATAATGARRIVGNGVVKDTVIEVISDSFNFNFGGGQQVWTSVLASNAAVQHHSSISMAPLVIGPQQSMVVVAWGVTKTGGTVYELQMGWVEK